MVDEPQRVMLTVEYTAEMEIPIMVDAECDPEVIAEDIFWSHAGDIVAGELTSQVVDTDNISLSNLSVDADSPPSGTAD